MRITILGAGWLGLPLGEALALAGHEVSGTTTSTERIPELQVRRVKGEVLSLGVAPSDSALLDRLLDVEVLVISIPPGRANPEVVKFHTAQIRSVIESKSVPGRVYHISTTGVYGNGPGEVDESSPISPERPSAIAVARVEEMLRGAYGEALTVIRPAGLIGWGRHGVRMMAGQKAIPGGDNPVNLISGEDVVEVAFRLIDQRISGGVYNVCCDVHPTRREFYTSEARRLGLVEPEFLPGMTGDSKIVLAEKIKSRLSYSWKYPDPRMIPWVG